MRRVAMILAILLAVAAAVADLTYKEGPEADEVYEMANKNIVWYYAGK